ncbi:MAG: hypothetical protein ACJ8GO_06765 [Ramlibacter sp.]
MKAPPRSPSELAQRLVSIFPSLPRDFGSSGESVLVSAGPTFESVLREFAHWFGRDVDQLPDRQLRRLLDFIAACRAEPGPLADAMAAFVDDLGELQDSRLQALLSAPFLRGSSR